MITINVKRDDEDDDDEDGVDEDDDNDEEDDKNPNLNLAMCGRCWNASHTANHHNHRCSQHNSETQTEGKL